MALTSLSSLPIPTHTNIARPCLASFPAPMTYPALPMFPPQARVHQPHQEPLTMRSICDKLGEQPTTFIKPTEILQTVTALAKLASPNDQTLFLRTICQLLHRGGLDYQIQVNVLRLLHGMPISDPTIIQEILSLIATGEVVIDVNSPLGRAAAKRLRDLGALGVLLTNCHPMDLGPAFFSSALEIASTVAYYHPGTALWDALTAVFARGGFLKPFAAELMERRLEASFAYHAYVMLRHLPLQVMMTHVATLLGDLIPWQEETLLSKGSLKLLLSFNDPHVALAVCDALIGQVDGVDGRRKKAQTGSNVVAYTLAALLPTPVFPPEILTQRFPAINHLLAAEDTDQVLREAVIGAIKVKVPMGPHYLHLVEGITITMNGKERVCERLEIANFLMRIPWVPAWFSEGEDEWFGGKKGHSVQGAVETLMGKWVDDHFPAIREKAKTTILSLPPVCVAPSLPLIIDKLQNEYREVRELALMILYSLPASVLNPYLPTILQKLEGDARAIRLMRKAAGA